MLPTKDEQAKAKATIRTYVAWAAELLPVLMKTPVAMVINCDKRDGNDFCVEAVDFGSNDYQNGFRWTVQVELCEELVFCLGWHQLVVSIRDDGTLEVFTFQELYGADGAEYEPLDHGEIKNGKIEWFKTKAS